MVMHGCASGGQVSPPPHREVAVWWEGARACKALFPWRLDHLSTAVKSTANLEFSVSSLVLSGSEVNSKLRVYSVSAFFIVSSLQKLEADYLQIFMGATKHLPDYLSQQNRLYGTCKLQLNSHVHFLRSSLLCNYPLEFIQSISLVALS